MEPKSPGGLVRTACQCQRHQRCVLIYRPYVILSEIDRKNCTAGQGGKRHGYIQDQRKACARKDIDQVIHSFQGNTLGVR